MYNHSRSTVSANIAVKRFRFSSYQFTVYNSSLKNQHITSTVSPHTVRGIKSHSTCIAVQTLTVANPKISSNNTIVEAIAVKDGNKPAPVFPKKTAIRIKQEDLRKNEIKFWKIIFKCKTCTIEIDGTPVPLRVYAYNKYKEHLIGKQHKKQLAQLESFYCTVWKFSLSSKYDFDGHLDGKAQRVKTHKLKQKLKNCI